MIREASISDDGVYRWSLTREWDAGEGIMSFIMLNPSTADAAEDDPTIRRCMGYAIREGCKGIFVANLFAFRATNPADLRDALGINIWPSEPRAWGQALRSRITVVAWGAMTPPWLLMMGMSRAKLLLELNAAGPAVTLHCLGKTANGNPRHPLYVRKDEPLEVWK